MAGTGVVIIPGAPDPGQVHQKGLPGARYTVIDESMEGVAAFAPLEPRCHEPAAQHDDKPGEMLADEADHGKGAQGLAQVVQGDTGDGCIALFDEGRNPAGKPAIKGTGFVLAGQPGEDLLT